MGRGACRTTWNGRGRWSGSTRTAGRIGDWHGILRSGRDLERIGHRTAERKRRALAIRGDRLAARRDHADGQGETGSAGARDVLEGGDRVSPRLRPSPEGERPERGEDGLPALTLGGTIALVARLGGYLARRGDAPSGHQVLQEGFTRMSPLAYALECVEARGEHGILRETYGIGRVNND